tara:strand:+ start:738 stop:968 length:231 start_codon:yes stop_codon:yes gene_type:complete
MTDENDEGARLVSLGCAATRIFGDSSLNMRRQVTRMIAAGDLRGWRPAKNTSWWIVAASLDDFIAQMERRESDPAT